MAIKYEVHSIENSQGTGEERKYIQLRNGKAKSLDEMATEMAHSSTVTAADIKAVLTELGHFAIKELSAGNRVYLPEIGYLSLAVGNTPTDKLPKGKITGKDIYLRSINFQPMAQLLKQVRSNVKFEKSDYSTLSVRYTEEELWQKIETYLSTHPHITRRIMREQFGIGDHLAMRWLGHFVESGRLSKEKVGRQWLYRLATNG